MVRSGRPTVQLLHERPDGSSHVDWLLARDASGTSPLVCLRLPARVDDLPAGRSLAAERIADHRTRYLTYEGPLTNDRGRVSRLRRGSVRRGELEGVSWRLEIIWTEPDRSATIQSLLVEHEGDRRWTVRVLATEAGDAAAPPPAGPSLIKRKEFP